jgi:hypothetical protein
MNIKTIFVMILGTLILSLILSGCATQQQPPPKPTSLQVESMQTQTFETTKRKAFNAVMTVFQNKGYTIQSADLDTGFITAKSATTGVGSGIGPMGRAPTHIDTTMTATAFVSTLVKKDKTLAVVRLSFVINKTTSGVGGTYTENIQVLDANVYKMHFSDIRQQIFVASAVQ